MTSNLNHGRQFDYGSGSLCNNGEGCETGGNIYEDDVRSSGGGGSAVKTLQLFDIFPSSTALTSPGGMEAYLGFPFTSDQLKELERQAMIYKYMLASVPVPPELLSPISSNSPAVAPDPCVSLNGRGIFNLRNLKNGDLEPGRCKRTDGKKWRCSKEVAPNQKYCERHLHRGRPRSRKPVEVKNTVSINTNMHATSAASDQILASNETSLLDLDSMIEAEMVAMCVANPQWQHLMYTDIANEGSVYNTNASVFHQDYVENQSMNVFSYTDYPAPDHAVHQSGNDQGYIGSFLNPGLVSLEKHSHTETPRGFIDAWSYNNGNAESSVSSDQGNFPSSSLTLTMAMAAGNIIDEQMEKIETGSVRDYDDHKREDSSWLGPVSFMPFAQGGPLAEALRPKSTTLKGSNSASLYYSISPSATTVSSPSGVLHRSSFSHSDGSGCNSPTLAAPTVLSEAVAFRLLN
ncbi:growth-regulating factor 7-like [Olea europaea subsp. europaea]|uniref:Growth-regulating factor n=1 Tax=Olea europaea subsp. europaea TaxID=158383 RepID=A0A8S0TZ44_OLEEU|nr:growth-regulating factor 7-like [Olea europaea subsp. europaea]